MKKMIVTGIALLLCIVHAKAQTLYAGMPVPELKVNAWLKGKTVTGFEKGKVYVVEFWATWCGPCRETISMLTALAAKYKEVTVIGISVSERNPDYVKVFVDDMGAKMDYLVATDLTGEPGAPAGYMAKHWLAAAGAPGIPFAFIIGRGGHIAYTGATAGLEEKLKEIIANN